MPGDLLIKAVKTKGYSNFPMEHSCFYCQTHKNNTPTKVASLFKVHYPGSYHNP